MTARRAARRPRGREAKLAFDALAIEGGLLSPDWLARAAQLGAGGQSEADYGVPKGLNLRDEIGRYWRVAQAHWHDLAAGRKAKGEPGALARAFVTSLLRDVFGFSSLVEVEPVVIAERTYPIGHAALGGRVPVVIAPAGAGVDALSPMFGDGTRRRSAFGLLQEHLNAAEGALWGLVSDGLVLRMVRDNASLTRPAWIEADLQRIFTEERYADFAALWLLAHETRFGRIDQLATACLLEAWRNAGREEGTRAREHLRGGVEDALVALGQGFLAHPDNGALRTALHDGTLSTTVYFQQLLRLVYRLIFLLTVEERDLLHPDGTPKESRSLYADGYGLRRLRERSVKRSAHDRHADLWEGTKVVLRGLAQGEARLGLPALAGLFATGQCPALDVCKLENRALLLAMFRLSWLREATGLSRVNWRDMGPEELGSVYESLLELVPQVSQDGRAFGFAQGDATRGNARKTTGSYYTPDSLVQVLLDSALEPVVADTIAGNPGDPVQALLSLAVVDPACGSGHFLLAAARRLAGHVARLQARGTPSAAEYRHALRQVVSRCIHGVDLNPMAVELCRVSLWMEALEPGLPLTFLDAHLQCGNALLGATPELMAGGVPDEAWAPIEGDDKKVASALKKRNKAEAAGQGAFAWGGDGATDDVAAAVTELESASDDDLDALVAKEAAWAEILASAGYRRRKLVADAWCAAFVWPKEPGPFADAAPTTEPWRRLRDGKASALLVQTTEALAEQYRFFHWHLAFPAVFARGGFDVVLGNPPYIDSETMTRTMPKPRAVMGVLWQSASGNWDLFVPFVELASRLLRVGGYQAQVTPNKLIASDYCGALQQLLLSRKLTTILDFTGHKLFHDASIDVVVATTCNLPSAMSDVVAFQKWGEAGRNFATIRELRSLPSGYLSLPLSGLDPRCVALMSGPFPRIQGIAEVGDGATTSEAYTIKDLVREGREEYRNDPGWVKLVNTGTIDPFMLLWGRREAKYLGFKGNYPVIEAGEFRQRFPRRAGQAGTGKVVVAGLASQIEAAVAPTAWLCGKSAVQVIPAEGICPYAICVVLNSSLINELYRGVFGMRGMGASSMNVGPRQIELIPMPEICELQPAKETPAEALALLKEKGGETSVAGRRDRLSVLGKALHAAHSDGHIHLSEVRSFADSLVRHAFGVGALDS